MIKRHNDMKYDIRENMRGGDGKVKITNVLDEGEYKGKARLLGVITLEPGCSIGGHIHENEAEVFYIMCDIISLINKNLIKECLNV